MARPGRAVLLALIALCVSAGPAAGATFTVNSVSDAPDGSPGNGSCAVVGAAGGICTLRAAVQEANAFAGTDTIVVPAGTYALTRAGAAEQAALNGDLDVTQSVTFDGAGARSTVVDQQVAEGVLDVRSGAGTVTVEGLTLRGGDSAGSAGAGLANRASVMLVDSAVRDNGSIRSPGAGIYNAGSLTVDRSLIAANSSGAAAGGGGIYNDGGVVALRNSTLSGNSAPTGAALVDAGNGPSTAIEYSTISANTPGAGGAAVAHTGGGQTSVRGSVVAANAGSGIDCAGPIATLGHNVESGVACGFTGTGDRQAANPLLAPLAYSGPGDATETHVPQPGSPAIDGGSPAGCPGVDQRGLGRPSGPACDTGAVEVQQAGAQPPAVRPSALALDPFAAERRPGDDNVVTATARNDDGSPAAGRTVRYAITGPNAGGGIATTDGAGVARIAWDGVHEGSDLLSAYVDTNGDLTPGADEPVAQASVRWTLPTPRQGRTVNIEPVSGVVRIRPPRSRSSSRVSASGSLSSLLTEARQVAIGTSVDVRRGRVRMTTSAGRGATQNAQFYGGVYVTRQPTRGTRPVTELRLTEVLLCRARSSGKVGASRARSRRLWGNGRGRFRTRGRHSVATVRGTIWVQKDTCTTTTTTVRRGTVDVRDLVKRRTVRVKAGRRYVARARRR